MGVEPKIGSIYPPNHPLKNKVFRFSIGGGNTSYTQFAPENRPPQ